MWRHIVSQLKFLHLQTLSFFIIGIDIRATEQQAILQKPALFFIYFVGTLLISISMGSYAVKYRHDIDLVASVMDLFISGCLVVVKVIVFLPRMRRFANLIKNFEELAEKANIQECELWRAENLREQLYITVYHFGCWFCGSMFLAKPLLAQFYSYFTNASVAASLPMAGLFPYDASQPLYYTLSYILNVIYVYFCVVASVGIDGLFCWFVHNTSAHFRILHLQLVTMAEDIVAPNSVVTFRGKIGATVLYHNRLIQLANEFEGVFSPIILAEVTMSCLQLTFFAYQLATKIELSKLPLILMALAVISTQLVLYCFGGQRIQNESNVISDAIYLLFPWDRMTTVQKNSLLLPLQKAQHINTLSGYFFVADLNLLVWVFKTAGSFTTLLLAVKEKNEDVAQ